MYICGLGGRLIPRRCLLPPFMKTALTKYFSQALIVLGVCIISSCKSDKKLKTFPLAYQYLLEPYTTKHTAIFSFEEKSDTITFYPIQEWKEKVRHLERGFYDVYNKRIVYELTPGSYHKLTPDDYYGHNKDRFLRLTNKSSTDRTSVELFFLHVGFDEDAVESQIQNNPMILSDNNPLDSSGDWKIKSLKFERGIGIIEFTDWSGHVWNRKK